MHIVVFEILLIVLVMNTQQQILATIFMSCSEEFQGISFFIIMKHRN